MEVKFIFNPEREESAGKPTNSEAQLPNGKAMTDRELMDKAWDYLASYTVGERPNASEVNDFIAVIEDRMNQPEQELMIDCPRCGHCCPQLNQEPVAWRYDQAKYRTNDLRGRQWAFNVFSQTRPYIDEMVQNVTPLYTTPPAAQPFWDLFDENQRLRAELKFNTTPPQRQWVGLTNEEIKSLPSWWPSYEDAPALIQLVKDVEAKLREKNGG